MYRATYEGAEIVGHLQPFGEEEVYESLGERTTYLKNVCWSPWDEAVEGKKCGSGGGGKGRGVITDGAVHRGFVFGVRG